MKIVTKTGNLLDITSGHIVHGCNSQGIMGAGVALGIKDKWPAVYNSYRHVYNTDGLMLGQVIPALATENIMVWNAITQDLYGTHQRQVNYEAIAVCFESINQMLVNDEFLKNFEYIPTIINIPLIGAGRGGGNWEIIREIIEQTVTVPVILWLPDDTVDTI